MVLSFQEDTGNAVENLSIVQDDRGNIAHVELLWERPSYLVFELDGSADVTLVSTDLVASWRIVSQERKPLIRLVAPTPQIGLLSQPLTQPEVAGEAYLGC